MATEIEPAAVSGSSTGETSLKYAWYVAIVLMLCNTLSFIDRQILGLLVDPIKLDLGISDTRIGLLQGLAFGIFYTLLGMPMGRIVDRGNRRKLVAMGIFCWSLMTGLCSTARGFWTLFAARMGVGVGEATLSPSAFSLLSDYFPKERLATALSIFSMGVFFGSGLALIVGGLIIGALGSWRLTFVIVGLPGLLAGLLVFTIKEPKRKNLLGGQATKLSVAEVIDQIKLRWQSVVGICLAFAFQALCNYSQQAAAYYDAEKSKSAYTTIDSYLADLVDILRGEIEELIRLGCAYIQIDSPQYTALLDPKLREGYRQRGNDPDRLLDLAIEMDNAIISSNQGGQHAGITFGLHLCRGNNQSKFYAEGDYGPITKVFSKTKFNRFLLEFDDARSGGFDPLAEVPADRTVVLGLVSSKKAALESKDELKRRIEEASKFVPLERLALSPQCGFASTLEGNLLTEADQEAKLRLAAETARAVWGA